MPILHSSVVHFTDLVLREALLDARRDTVTHHATTHRATTYRATTHRATNCNYTYSV